MLQNWVTQRKSAICNLQAGLQVCRRKALQGKARIHRAGEPALYLTLQHLRKPAQGCQIDRIKRG